MQNEENCNNEKRGRMFYLPASLYDICQDTTYDYEVINDIIIC